MCLVLRFIQRNWGARYMFQRPEAIRELKYVQYLGDGASEGYQKVSAQPSQPRSGRTEIEKSECIDHDHKRMDL
jgi:hypothetical protein